MLSRKPKPTPSNVPLPLAVLLGSIVVHADEMTSVGGDPLYDGVAIRTLLTQQPVQEWLNSFPPGLLPEKRNNR